MGDPRKLRKKYAPPRHPWQADRIEEENKLVKDYGLKNKKEVWRAELIIRKYKHLARSLLRMLLEQRRKEEEKLLNKLRMLGLLKEKASLDDVLSLKTEVLLERRLQTIVWKKGLAGTMSQARQFITHGHISIAGRKTTTPSTLITVEKENLINWYGAPISFSVKKKIEEVGEIPKEKKIMPKEEKIKEIEKVESEPNVK